MPSKVPITVGSVIEYTLCLGLTTVEDDLVVMEEDDLVVMEGDLSSSLGSVSPPRRWTMHSTCISETI